MKRAITFVGCELCPRPLRSARKSLKMPTGQRTASLSRCWPIRMRRRIRRRLPTPNGSSSFRDAAASGADSRSADS